MTIDWSYVDPLGPIESAHMERAHRIVMVLCAQPWTRPEPNPFPRLRLFRWLP